MTWLSRTDCVGGRPSRQDTFFEPMYIKGSRQRWEVDVDWTVGPASVRTEYTRVTDDRLQQGLGNQDLPDARAQSWYVAGSWILTGEPKTRPVKAAREFLRDGVGGGGSRRSLRAPLVRQRRRSRDERRSCARPVPKTSARAAFAS